MFAFYSQVACIKDKMSEFCFTMGGQSLRSHRVDPLAPTFHLRNYTLDLLARILNRY